MTQPETRDVTVRMVPRRQRPISHQAAEDDLPLLAAESELLREHDAVTRNEVAGLAPPARRPDEVIRRRGELRAPVATRPGNGELQELVGRPVVEPVDDLLR